MSSKLIALLLLASLAMAHAVEDYQDDQSFEKEEITEKEKKTQKDEMSEKAEETTADEPKMIMEDMNTETSTALVQHDDPDSIKHKGFCHWGVAIWYKPGFSIRCSCMKCVCKPGGLWACAYEFAFCPYYYCGNQIYNPFKQICCCGKVYTKQAHHSCCGYFYYNVRISKCCNYYSVKPRKANCPRFKI